MKYKFSLVGLVSLFFLTWSHVNASLIDFQSGVGVSAFQSDGSTTLSSAGDSAFTFALGTFDESVLVNSVDLWTNGFSDQMVNTNNWLTAGPVANSFRGEILMVDGSATGQTAYILGYNASDESQIILFKNAEWTFPSFSFIDTESDIFLLQDSNTQMLLPNGSFSNFTDTFVMISAVPEPSTYALFAGVFAFGYIVIRRSRSQA
jgi:hypothetical protein